MKWIIPIVDQYNTDLIKPNSLMYAFRSVTDRGVGKYTIFLLNLLVLMNNELFSAYNEYDLRVND